MMTGEQVGSVAELRRFPVKPEGAFFDLFPVSVITTSTLHELQTLAPKTSIVGAVRSTRARACMPQPK